MTVSKRINKAIASFNVAVARQRGLDPGDELPSTRWGHAGNCLDELHSSYNRPNGDTDVDWRRLLKRQAVRNLCRLMDEDLTRGVRTPLEEALDALTF